MHYSFETFLAWLKDKLEGSKFALPALYQPASRIPIDIWRGTSNNTNGNEQSHRNAYRDGKNLLPLAGVMRSMQYDWRALAGIALFQSSGIYSRDQRATHSHRIARAVHRHGELFNLVYFKMRERLTCVYIVHVQKRVIEQAAGSPEKQRSPKKKKKGMYFWP